MIFILANYENTSVYMYILSTNNQQQQ